MKVKLPHQVIVGSKAFRVLYRPMVSADSDTVCGFMNGPRYEIEISTSENNTAELALSCLFHEVVHAVLYITGQSDSLGSDKAEEGIVVALENFLADTVDWKNEMWEEWKLVTLEKPK